MFEILYRITDKEAYLESLDETAFDNGGDVLGFFAISVNEKCYGHYHDKPLETDEFWWERITDWFTRLILAYKKLCHSEYVSVSDIESDMEWIEFKKNQDTAEVSIVIAEKEEGCTGFRLKPFEKYEYGEWHGESVKLIDIHDELSGKTSKYLEELRRINSRLLGCSYIAKLDELLYSF